VGCWTKRPVFVVAIVRLAGSPDIWLTPLMILGMQ